MMMEMENRYSTAEKEVDIWRDKIYEETKDMSDTEITKYIRERTMPIMREFHMISQKNIATKPVQL
jgi:hypothetical protein